MDSRVMASKDMVSRGILNKATNSKVRPFVFVASVQKH